MITQQQSQDSFRTGKVHVHIDFNKSYFHKFENFDKGDETPVRLKQICLFSCDKGSSLSGHIFVVSNLGRQTFYW